MAASVAKRPLVYLTFGEPNLIRLQLLCDSLQAKLTIGELYKLIQSKEISNYDDLFSFLFKTIGL